MTKPGDVYRGKVAVLQTSAGGTLIASDRDHFALLVANGISRVAIALGKSTVLLEEFDVYPVVTVSQTASPENPPAGYALAPCHIIADGLVGGVVDDKLGVLSDAECLVMSVSAYHTVVVVMTGEARGSQVRMVATTNSRLTFGPDAMIRAMGLNPFGRVVYLTVVFQSLHP